MRQPLLDVMHAAFPSDCRLCGGPMLGGRMVRVCESCMGGVRATDGAGEAACGRCGELLGMESLRFSASLGMDHCTPCQLVPPPFARAVSYAVYDAEMRALLHTLKFGRLRRVARHVLGEWMAAAVLQLHEDAAKDLLVVPVPMFRTRERKRGFNQAALLAEVSVARLRRSHPAWRLTLETDALQRVRDTHALHSLRPDQRRRGLQGAFAVCDAALVKGREVLLVDDIFTTGATARECSRALVRAGAHCVWVATVARAQPEIWSTGEGGVARWDLFKHNDSAATSSKEVSARKVFEA